MEMKDEKTGIKHRRRSELFEFPYFKRFPLLKIADDKYLVWHPTVLARALDEAVHLRFSDAGEDYTKPFSIVFENYVVELLCEVHPRLYTEADIKTWLEVQQAFPEAVVLFEVCNVLVEAKMGRTAMR